MSLVEGLDPQGSIWHYIAVTLREERERRGLSGNKLAQQIGCDRSYVSRVENGRIHLSRTYAEKIDALLGTHFTWLVRLAEAADGGDWFTGLVEYEERATRHRMWEYSLIPGLMQTRDYARAALSAGVAAGLITDVESALERRLARQHAVFDRENPPVMSVILNWTVLRQPVGGSDTMREQLAHLLELGDHPQVNVRVVEQGVGEHVGLDGSFRLLTVDDRDVAFADAPGRGRLMTTPTDVMRFATRYDRISDIAAPIGPSRALITEVMETYQ